MPTNPHPGTPNAVANGDGTLTFFDSNGCWVTRSGGVSLWRSNNPGRLMSPQEGEIGKDEQGRSIFPDYQTGEQALRGAIADAFRTIPTTIENKMYKVAELNNWGDPRPIMDDIVSQDLRGSNWYGGYHTGDVDGGGGIGNLVPVSTEDGQQRWIDAIKRFTGYSGNDTVGTESSLTCPDAGSGEGSEGGGSYGSYEENSYNESSY